MPTARREGRFKQCLYSSADKTFTFLMLLVCAWFSFFGESDIEKFITLSRTLYQSAYFVSGVEKPHKISRKDHFHVLAFVGFSRSDLTHEEMRFLL